MPHSIEPRVAVPVLIQDPEVRIRPAAMILIPGLSLPLRTNDCIRRRCSTDFHNADAASMRAKAFS
jgi:hypothetical protein